MERIARSIPKWTLIAPIGFLIYLFIPRYTFLHFIQCCVHKITPTLAYNIGIKQERLCSLTKIKQHSDWFQITNRINPNFTNLDLVGTRFGIFSSDQNPTFKRKKNELTESRMYLGILECDIAKN